MIILLKVNFECVKLFAVMGVHRIDFAIPVLPIIILVALICLLAYGVSLLTAHGTRKISPCDLLRGKD